MASCEQCNCRISNEFKIQLCTACICKLPKLRKNSDQEMRELERSVRSWDRLAFGKLMNMKLRRDDFKLYEVEDWAKFVYPNIDEYWASVAARAVNAAWIAMNHKNAQADAWLWLVNNYVIADHEEIRNLVLQYEGSRGRTLEDTLYVAPEMKVGALWPDATLLTLKAYSNMPMVGIKSKNSALRESIYLARASIMHEARPKLSEDAQNTILLDIIAPDN